MQTLASKMFGVEVLLTAGILFWWTQPGLNAFAHRRSPWGGSGSTGRGSGLWRREQEASVGMLAVLVK